VLLRCSILASNSTDEAMVGPGKCASVTVSSAFNRKDLEQKLKLPVNALEEWAHGLCNVLGLLVGIRDWVPRSQLTFTIELVLRNSWAVKSQLQSLLGGEPTPPDSDGDATRDESEEEVEDPSIYTDGDGEVALDFSGGGRRRSAGGGEEDQAFPGIANRLIAAHEHITQQKFNKNSLDVLLRMDKRKRFKNDAEWQRDFSDSDSDDEGKQVPARRTRVLEEDSEGEDQVLDDAHRQRSLGAAAIKRVPYDDDELDLPMKTDCENKNEGDAIFPSSWGYGPPVFSGVCVTSILSEHVPLYHVQIDVRRLKISYSDAEGLPVAYLFHKKILQRSLKSFVPEAGFALFFEERVCAREEEEEEEEEEEQVGGLSNDHEPDVSDEELETSIKEAWAAKTQRERDDYAAREKSKDAPTSRRASYLANYRMMAYREELLR